MVQNTLACASARNGSPLASACQAPLAKRSAPLILLVLKAPASGTCELLSRFKQKRTPGCSVGCNEAELLTQTSIEGGSIDTDVTAVAVMPFHTPSSAMLTMHTVAARQRIALRKSCCNSWDMGMLRRGLEWMANQTSSAGTRPRAMTLPVSEWRSATQRPPFRVSEVHRCTIGAQTCCVKEYFETNRRRRSGANPHPLPANRICQGAIFAHLTGPF